MNRGVLIFAHNNRDIDYVSLSLIAGKLAAKNLKVPVSLAVDSDTLGHIISSEIKKQVFDTFDRIIKTEIDIHSKNQRLLYDGESKKTISFINDSRSTAYEITPYDRTLLIDSDLFLFSNQLGQYWEVDSDVMISESFFNVRIEEQHILDTRISETGPRLRWATAVMFTKNQRSKVFFDLVTHVRDRYRFYSELYKFNPRIYRNDIAFSVAKHILDDFSEDTENHLPPILSVIDRDQLIEVKKNGRLIFLIGDERNPSTNKLASIINTDVHIMNKSSILRNYKNLIDL